MSRIAGARSRSVDEKLTDCIQHIKKMLAQGYTLGKMGAQDKDRNIVVRDILRVYRLNSHLSGMLMAFDFNKRVTLERVARERDRYCIDQSEARRMREASRPKPERVIVPKEMPVASDVGLYDWHLLGHDGLELVWWRKGGRHEVTVHSLEPQEYAYEDRWQPDGTHYVKRTWLRGDFKGGQMTEAAMVRILVEARDDMRSRQPDIVLQPMQTSLEKFKYLMR